MLPNRVLTEIAKHLSRRDFIEFILLSKDIYVKLNYLLGFCIPYDFYSIDSNINRWLGFWGTNPQLLINALGISQNSETIRILLRLLTRIPKINTIRVSIPYFSNPIEYGLYLINTRQFENFETYTKLKFDGDVINKILERLTIRDAEMIYKILSIYRLSINYNKLFTLDFWDLNYITIYAIKLFSEVKKFVPFKGKFITLLILEHECKLEYISNIMETCRNVPEVIDAAFNAFIIKDRLSRKYLQKTIKIN